MTVIPAGYGLAIGSFRGRKLILTLTLVAIVMPAASLVLPIFLELNAMGLIGSVFSIILPFAFFPFGVYLAYIYYATALPPGVLDAARIDGCSDGRLSVSSGSRWRGRSSRSSSSSASSPTGTTSSCPT